MAALLDVSLWPAESADQEFLQPLFRARQIVGRIHRPEDVVARHLRVERPNQPCEAFLADLPVNLTL